jgi:hypothetical protein
MIEYLAIINPFKLRAITNRSDESCCQQLNYGLPYRQTKSMNDHDRL